MSRWIALLAFVAPPRFTAILLGLAVLFVTQLAHAFAPLPLATNVTSNPEVLSVHPSNPTSFFAHPPRDPRVRAQARRLGAPARAQAQPSTHGPRTDDTTRRGRRGKTLTPSEPGGLPPPDEAVSVFYWQARPVIGPSLYDFRARAFSTELGVFLQADRYAFLTPGGTLWSWPGNNPFRWRDPSGRYSWEEFGNDFYKHSETAITASLGVSLVAATIATGGLAMQAVGLGTLEAGLAGLGAGAVATGTSLATRAVVIGTGAAGVARSCSNQSPANSLPQAQRLRMFFDRLQLSKPAANADKALDLLSRTLNAVEDAHSGVAAVTNPGLQYAGRMYPPQADFISRAADGSMTAVTKGQQILLGADGSIAVFSKATGEQIFFKAGQ